MHLNLHSSIIYNSQDMNQLASKIVWFYWFWSISACLKRSGLEEMATHSSVLAWRIPGTGEPGGLPSTGSHRVGHDWSDLAAAGLRKLEVNEGWLLICTVSFWGSENVLEVIVVIVIKLWEYPEKKIFNGCIIWCELYLSRVVALFFFNDERVSHESQ